MSTPRQPLSPQPGPSQPGPPQLGLTPPRQVAVAALAGAVIGYFLIGTLQWQGVTVPVTPWSLPIMLAALGAAGLVYSQVLRRQVAEHRAALTPEAAVRALVLGKTLLMTGAVVVGGHLLYVLVNLPRWEVPMPRQRVVHGVVTILAALLFGVAGRALEKACLVPPGHDEDGPGDDTPTA